MSNGTQVKLILSLFLSITPALSGELDDLLFGQYIMSTLETITESDNERSTSLILVSADGAGSGTFDILFDSDGDLGNGTLTYSIDSSRRLSVQAGTTDFSGAIHGEGTAFTMLSTNEGGFELFTAFKTSESMSNDVLIGAYKMTQYGVSRDAEESPEDSASVGILDLSFDGAGSGTYTASYSSNEDYGSGSFTYQLDDDGSFTVVADEESFLGMVSSDAQAFTMISTDSSDMGLFFGIKYGSNMDNSVAIGAYHMTELQSDVEEDPDMTSAGLFNISMSGDGNGWYTSLYNSDNEVGSGGFTYSISTDGSLMVYTEEDTFSGIISADGSYYTMINTNDSDLGIFFGIQASSEPTTVEEEFSISGAQSFKLYPGHPNPFNASTQIQYLLPADSQVKLVIFDVSGRLIQTLVNQDQSAGLYNIGWDARNSTGQVMPSGLYFLTLEAGSFIRTEKILLLK